MVSRIINEARVMGTNWLFGGPKGKLIYENPKIPPALFKGFHGTLLSRVDGQLHKGRFDNQGRDIYFVPKYTPNAATKAAFWAGECPKQGVILEVGMEEFPTKNHVFNTYLSPRGEDQKVYIIRGWLLNEEWLERAWHHRC